MTLNLKSIISEIRENAHYIYFYLPLAKRAYLKLFSMDFDTCKRETVSKVENQKKTNDLRKKLKVSFTLSMYIFSNDLV